MRTIIINTLGAGFQPSDLFFRAFRDTDLIWLTADFASIAKCAEMIDHLRSRENKAQDYHLVVLADLSRYELSLYEKSRKIIEKILAAYVMHQLLPQLEKTRDLPISVSMIGLCTAVLAGKSGTEDLLKLLQIGEEKTQRPTLRGVKGEQNDLVLEELFSAPLINYWQAGEKLAEKKAEQVPGDYPFSYGKKTAGAEEAMSKEANDALKETLALKIGEIIKVQRKYAPKAREDEVIGIKTCEFLVTEFEHIEQVYADLQINLAAFVRTLMQGKTGEPDLTILSPHSMQTLAQQLASAKCKVDAYLDDKAGPKYHPLEVCEDSMKMGSLRGKIHDALRQKAPDVAGVQEYLNAGPQGPVQQAKRQMHKAWLRYGEEKARFRELYRKLQEQYDPAHVREEERKIIQVCADAFSEWRDDVRDSSMPMKEAMLQVRPQLPPAVQTQTDAEVQKSLLNGELEKLEGYEDVRQQAEEIQRDFDRVSRLWGPREGSDAVSAFRRMTLIFAVVAVVVMLLPYAVMTWRVEGLFTPKLSVLAISAGVFAFLYFCAVLLWLWKVCSDMRGCADELEELTEQSRVSRQQSVAELVELYAQLMPQCMKDAMVRDCLERIDCANARRAAQYNLHRCYLKAARDELDDLSTALHLPAAELSGCKEKIPEIRYDLAPYEPENQPCYLLFGGKEGNE